MKDYFKCVDVNCLEDLTIDQQLVNEFFKQDFLSSNVSQPKKQLEEISDSFEMVELNNQSIHLSKLCKSLYPNSSSSSQLKNAFSPIFEDFSKTKENRVKDNLDYIPGKIKELRENVRKSGLAIEVKSGCYFHLDRISQILLQEKASKTDSSFSQFLNNQNKFAKKRVPLKQFKLF